MTTAVDCAKELQKLPKVYRLIRTADLQGMIRAYGREPVLVEVRAALEDQRQRVLTGNACPPDDEVLAAICRHVERPNRPTLYPVINFLRRGGGSAPRAGRERRDPAGRRRPVTGERKRRASE